MSKRKPTINLAVDAKVLSAFERTAGAFGHGKQKGLVLTAAMLHFLAADPRDQASAVVSAMQAEVDAGTARLLAEARRRQAEAVAARDEATAAARGDASPNPALWKPARAAKKRGPARKGIKDLPRLEGLA